ncbi:DUF2892 domain-containing protein [Palleronia sediminis]|uniref:DUF2892 domain-containing protein n=1 Tax=Palleronia sediminis TaxID=2547833 RepID=A0A4R6ADY0_9RHOB|nr:DUF2892 domain-containing protein [Palleronia sediminis]TDL79413.1 DUF2892 domain-containing protein [Palleronia sediminis]
MTTNEGNLDRILRGIVGLVLIALPLFSSMAAFANPLLFWGSIVIGAVLAVTAVTGFCPAYRLLGINTCRTR